jgi:hypothetical protein
MMWVWNKDDDLDLDASCPLTNDNFIFEPILRGILSWDKFVTGDKKGQKGQMGTNGDKRGQMATTLLIVFSLCLL